MNMMVWSGWLKNIEHGVNMNMEILVYLSVVVLAVGALLTQTIIPMMIGNLIMAVAIAFERKEPNGTKENKSEVKRS
jgi:hypothetical protein